MRFGLKFKFIVSFSVLIILTSAVLSGFLIRKQTELIRNKLEDKGRYLAKNLASSSEYGVLVEDTPLLRRLLDSVSADEDVAHIAVLNKGGKLLASVDKRVLPHQSPSGQSRQFWLPVTSVKTIGSAEEVVLGAGMSQRDNRARQMVEEIGTVKVWITTARMAEQIGDMKRVVFLITLQIVCLGILLVFLLVKIVMSPLERLVEATKRISVGDFSSEVVVKQKDELGQLAAAFNLMTRNLKKLIDEIKDYNRNLEKKVEQRTKKLKETQAILVQSEKLSAVGQLTSGVAHELNNPLSAVIGFSQLALGTDTGPPISRYLERIHMEAERCARIVNNLLTFSRKSKPERKPIDINSIIESTLDLVSYQLRVNKVKATTELDYNLPMTVGDPHQLQQVFLNIITNASQAMSGCSKEGSLLVKTARRDDTILIVIADTGPGIPEENLGKVFDPFFTTKEAGEGTGLGLSICYGIVKEHQGNISAASQSGQGATLLVELPIVETKPIAETKEKPQREAASAPTASILVVDDEEGILDLLNDFLGAKGYEVDTVSSGEKALEKLRARTYDLIMCDMKMPNMSGQELHSEIKMILPELSKRMIFLTGDTVNPETESFVRRAGNKCIAKPFDLEELLSFVQDFLVSQSACQPS
ncbi:MAG: response regulator [Candidatus Eisenbacteria bacterium]|nr:response regulator [Candidatus Eisenbacteria bacterium]